MKTSATLMIFVGTCLCAHADDKSFGSWGGSGQPCAIVSIDEQSSYKRSQALSIRLFSASAPSAQDAGVVEEVRRKMAEALAERLGKSKFFRSVTVIPDGEQAHSDYVLDGVFLSARHGNVLKLKTDGVI